MQPISISQSNKKPFVFEWKPQVDLSGQLIVAFGGAGNLSEVFVYAAAVSGAKIVLADYVPPQPPERDRAEARIKEVARNVHDLSGYGMPLVVSADVTDPTDVRAAVEEIVNREGRIDTVVDFAGVHHRPFELSDDEISDTAEIFRRVMDVNLAGAFNVTAAVAKPMVRQGAGHIIHLCSSGSRLSLYGSYAYNASKHGLEGLIKTAAAQLARFGVRVNGIAPGTVETNLNRELLRDTAGNPKLRAKSILAHTPTKRFVTREGVAETLVGMCVPQRHLTGNVVFADDGYNIEGHSWPEGTQAVYEGQEAVDSLYEELKRRYRSET